MNLAFKSSDIHLKRDSLKRLANVYIEISHGLPPFGPADSEIFAIRADLEATTQLEIDDNEKNDLYWLRKFSKVRGVYYIEKMRDLVKHVDS